MLTEMQDLPNCRVCIDINDWQQKAQRLAFASRPASSASANSSGSITARIAGTAGLAGALASSTPSEPANISARPPDCPPDSTELGRSTWTFLHTMSAYYPTAPSLNQQSDMLSFIRVLSNVYPCSSCAAAFRDECRTSPPTVGSREELMQWFCERHNEVNERQGKERFDCAKVMERWRTGPADGRCDATELREDSGALASVPCVRGK